MASPLALPPKKANTPKGLWLIVTMDKKVTIHTSCDREIYRGYVHISCERICDDCARICEYRERSGTNKNIHYSQFKIQYH